MAEWGGPGSHRTKEDDVLRDFKRIDNQMSLLMMLAGRSDQGEVRCSTHPTKFYLASFLTTSLWAARLALRLYRGLSPYSWQLPGVLLLLLFMACPRADIIDFIAFIYSLDPYIVSWISIVIFIDLCF